jgi:hypothetical protein
MKMKHQQITVSPESGFPARLVGKQLVSVDLIIKKLKAIPDPEIEPTEALLQIRELIDKLEKAVAAAPKP